jgi:hypothetical protein
MHTELVFIRKGRSIAVVRASSLAGFPDDFLVELGEAMASRM